MVSRLWNCSVACLCFLPPGRSKTRRVLYRRGLHTAPQPRKQGAASWHPRRQAPVQSAFHLPFPLSRRGRCHLPCHVSATWSGQRSIPRPAETGPLGSSPECCGGGLGVASPLHPSVPSQFSLCASHVPSSHAGRPMWLGLSPHTPGSAAHPHPTQWCLGVCGQPLSPQGGQHFSGTSCAGNFHVHSHGVSHRGPTTPYKAAGVLEEETEAQRCEVTCLRSHSKSVESWCLNPQHGLLLESCPCLPRDLPAQHRGRGHWRVPRCGPPLPYRGGAWVPGTVRS